MSTGRTPRKAAAPGGDAVKMLATNRKARHDYHIEETFEAGIALQGNEVKSIRQGQATLRDGYAAFDHGELYLRNCHVTPYEQAGKFHADPDRPRKLLMHREQLRRLVGKVEEKGLTLIPLSLYLKGPYVKVSLGLARGKREYDRREDIKAREAEREVARVSRGRGSRYDE